MLGPRLAHQCSTQKSIVEVTRQTVFSGDIAGWHGGASTNLNLRHHLKGSGAAPPLIAIALQIGSSLPELVRAASGGGQLPLPADLSALVDGWSLRIDRKASPAPSQREAGPAVG